MIIRKWLLIREFKEPLTTGDINRLVKELATRYFDIDYGHTSESQVSFEIYKSKDAHVHLIIARSKIILEIAPSH